MGDVQADSGTSMGLEQLGESFAEDVLCASRVVTAEATYDETQSKDATVAGQVGDGASIVTMDAIGCCATTGASGGRGSGNEQGHNGSRCQDEVIETQAGTLRESIEEERHGRYSAGMKGKWRILRDTLILPSSCTKSAGEPQFDADYQVGRARRYLSAVSILAESLGKTPT
jgi:hypothetical protein